MLMAKQNFSVASQRTTIARTLADPAHSVVNAGHEHDDVAELPAETKDLALARTLLNVTGAISDATAPGQRTLVQATALNRATLGGFVDEVCSYRRARRATSSPDAS